MSNHQMSLIEELRSQNVSEEVLKEMQQSMKIHLERNQNPESKRDLYKSAQIFRKKEVQPFSKDFNKNQEQRLGRMHQKPIRSCFSRSRPRDESSSKRVTFDVKTLEKKKDALIKNTVRQETDSKEEKFKRGIVSNYRDSSGSVSVEREMRMKKDSKERMKRAGDKDKNRVKQKEENQRMKTKLSRDSKKREESSSDDEVIPIKNSKRKKNQRDRHSSESEERKKNEYRSRSKQKIYSSSEDEVHEKRFKKEKQNIDQREKKKIVSSSSNRSSSSSEDDSSKFNKIKKPVRKGCNNSSTPERKNNPKKTYQSREQIKRLIEERRRERPNLENIDTMRRRRRQEENRVEEVQKFGRKFASNEVPGQKKKVFEEVKVDQSKDGLDFKNGKIDKEDLAEQSIILERLRRKREAEEQDRQTAILLDAQERKERRRRLQYNEPEPHCGICRKKMKDMYPLEQCTHVFCRTCIEEHIVVEFTEEKQEIRCPTKGCDSSISLSDKSELLKKNNPEILYEIEKRYMFLMMGEELMKCKSLNCDYRFLLDPNSTDFKCPECKGCFIYQKGEIKDVKVFAPKIVVDEADIKPPVVP